MLIVLNCGKHFVYVVLCWLIVMIEVCRIACLSNTHCYRILIAGETLFFKWPSLQLFTYSDTVPKLAAQNTLRHFFPPTLLVPLHPTILRFASC